MDGKPVKMSEFLHYLIQAFSRHAPPEHGRIEQFGVLGTIPRTRVQAWFRLWGDLGLARLGSLSLAE